MLFSAPLDVARTKAWTLASSATSASVRCDPMKPSAPVTRQVRPAKTSPYSRRSAANASSVQVESEGFGFITRMEAVEETKPSPLPGRSALRSGLATGLSFLALSASGALAGVYLAHKFGRNARTDGFMGAYGVYLVLVLGAQAFRMVVVPDLTRAEAEGRLRDEFRAYVVAFVALAVPVTALVVVFQGFFGELITGRLPHTSAVIAGRALVWLVPTAFAQLLAALAASALAARDSYGPAAAGFALGGIGSLVFFVLAADRHGLISLAWGLTLNGAIALGIPLVALVVQGGRPRHLRGASLRLKFRLVRLAQGIAVPLAVQGLYVLALRFAAGT